MNCVHAHLEQLFRDDAAALQMADEGCPNEPIIPEGMQLLPGKNPSPEYVANDGGVAGN